MAKYNIEKMLLNKDVVMVGEALSSGISKPVLYDTLKRANYEKIGHGVYASHYSIVDEMELLHRRCPNAVFSHDEALYYHQLIDREPIRHTITVYSGYNTKRLSDDGIKVYTIKKELLGLGKTMIINNMGNRVPMYDLERTVCDMVRSRSNFEIQDFQTALKTYIKRKDKNLNLLMKYAKQLRVDNIIRQYLEVLL